MDPLHECLVFLILAAFYSALGAAVWLIFCSGRFRAVNRLNGIISQRPADSPDSGKMTDLDSVLRTLESEGRISREFAVKIRRIAPVWYRGRWVSYPCNAYWDYRYEGIISPE